MNKQLSNVQLPKVQEQFFNTISLQQLLNK
jgi:hypothetical protein